MIATACFAASETADFVEEMVVRIANREDRNLWRIRVGDYRLDSPASMTRLGS